MSRPLIGMKAAAAKLEADAQARQKLDARYAAPTMSIADGERVAGVWFTADDPESEPVLIDQHTCRLGATAFRSFPCSAHTADDDSEPTIPCLGCYLIAKGDDRVKKASRAFFNVADPRLFHKVIDRKRSTKDRTKYAYEQCTKSDDNQAAECNLCDKYGMKTLERGGAKKREMSTRELTQFKGAWAELAHLCVCGGAIRGGACKKCGGNTSPEWNEVAWTIKRSGSDKDTSYTFIPQVGEERPNWVAALKPINMLDVVAPIDADQVARMLNMPNPFLSGASMPSREETESYDSESPIDFRTASRKKAAPPPDEPGREEDEADDPAGDDSGVLAELFGGAPAPKAKAAPAPTASKPGFVKPQKKFVFKKH